jgi:hypothetical protein
MDKFNNFKITGLPEATSSFWNTVKRIYNKLLQHDFHKPVYSGSSMNIPYIV